MKRKLNIKLIIIASVIFIIAIVAAVLFFTTDFFRTKRSAFLRYFEDTKDALNLVEENEFQDYQEQKQTTSFIRNANLSIQSSSNIADSNILDKLNLSINEKSDYANEKMSADIKINNGNETIEKISVIRNKNTYAFYSADISTGYIGIQNTDLKRIAKNAGIDDTTYIPNSISEINIEKVFETTKLENNKLKDLLKLMKNNVPTVAYKKEGKKRIRINDTPYSTNAYSLTLNEQDNATLQISLLSKISQDSILMDYITSKCRLLNFNEEYTNLNTINEKMKLKIEELKKDPSKANDLQIVVYEYKQKNIRTEITTGDTKITINHLKEGESEISSIKINNKTIMIQKQDEKYIMSYKDEENELSYNIEYTQTGSIENNDIKNKVIVTKQSGIKSITYLYEDTVNFTNNLGKVDDFSNKNVHIINNMNDEEMQSFFTSLKELINNVYVSKGASIGINLDPIFNI